jgi:hypothetical protein
MTLLTKLNWVHWSHWFAPPLAGPRLFIGLDVFCYTCRSWRLQLNHCCCIWISWRHTVHGNTFMFFLWSIVHYIAHALLCMRKVSMIPTNNFRKLEDRLNPSLSPNSPANLGCTRWCWNLEMLKNECKLKLSKRIPVIDFTALCCLLHVPSTHFPFFK